MAKLLKEEPQELYLFCFLFASLWSFCNHSLQIEIHRYSIWEQGFDLAMFLLEQSTELPA